MEAIEGLLPSPPPRRDPRDTWRAALARAPGLDPEDDSGVDAAAAPGSASLASSSPSLGGSGLHFSY